MRFDGSLIVTAQTTSPCIKVASSRADVGILGPVNASGVILMGMVTGLPWPSIVVKNEYA